MLSTIHFATFIFIPPFVLSYHLLMLHVEEYKSFKCWNARSLCNAMCNIFSAFEKQDQINLDLWPQENTIQVQSNRYFAIKVHPRPWKGHAISYKAILKSSISVLFRFRFSWFIAKLSTDVATSALLNKCSKWTVGGVLLK